VALIVIGHVIAVFIAHVTALRVFGTGRSGLMSQIPMVALDGGVHDAEPLDSRPPIVG
jgi:hypothetical protein